MDNLEVVKLEIGKLEVKPGDTLVFAVRDFEAAGKFMEMLGKAKEQLFPNANVLVLAGDVKMTVVRPGETIVNG